MRYIIISLLIILLAGCQTTQTSKQTPSWKSYGKEEQKTKFEKTHKDKALLGDPESQMTLAYVYYGDPQLSERQKAKVYFENNVKLGNEDAMYFLSAGQLVGKFGEVSETEYLKYADTITKENPDFAKIHDVDKEQWQTALNEKFESLKVTYDSSVELCEQALPSIPKKLTSNSSYAEPKYLNRCLNQFSFNENVTPRLLAIASFQQIICDGQKRNGKTCISDGYRNLANENFPENASEEYLSISSGAMKAIYNENRELYKVYTLNSNTILPSESIRNALKIAFNYYEKDQYDDAIKILENELLKPKTTEYDKAYAEKFIAQMYVTKDTVEARDTAIGYINQALSRNMSAPHVEFEMTELLNNLLLINKHYKKYLINMSEILSQKEPTYHFLPAGTSQRIINAFAPEPSQTKSAAKAH